MQDPATLVTNPDLLHQIAQLQLAATQLVQIATHGVLGVGSAHTLEWLKGKPWFKAAWNTWSPRTKTIIGGGMALLTSLGITASFVHAAGTPEGTYVITLSGLTAASVTTHISSFFQSWIAQQGYFQAVLKPTPVVVSAGPAPLAEAPAPAVAH